MDPIVFNQVPTTLRLPGVFIEVDASKAGRSQDPGRVLLVGQMLGAGTATAGVVSQVVSQADANAQFGIGSMLADMFWAARRNNNFDMIFALPLADASGGVQATGTITVTTPPTAPGSIPLYITDIKVPVAVAGTETAAQTAAEIAAAINAGNPTIGGPALPVTATVAGAVVTLTARHKGTLGNQIQIAYALGGTAAGEAMPTGFASTVVALANGATDPSAANGFASLGDVTYDYIVMPYTDSGNLNAAGTLMNVPGGRWDYNRMLWGHVFTAQYANLSALTTFGLTRNDPHISVMGYYDTPTPVWRWVAATVSATQVCLLDDPARPVQGVKVAGVMAPPLGSVGQFTMVERNTLLWSGISTFTIDNYGGVYIERWISTYQYNSQGVSDDAWLSVEKTFTLMAVQRQLQAMLLANFPRYKLAQNGTVVQAGSNVVTPAIARGYVVSALRGMEAEGLLQNVAAFIAQVTCAINPNNPDRLDILFPPSLIGQLRTMAVLSQFHIYAPAGAATTAVPTSASP